MGLAAVVEENGLGLKDAWEEVEKGFVLADA